MRYDKIQVNYHSLNDVEVETVQIALLTLRDFLNNVEDTNSYTAVRKINDLKNIERILKHFDKDEDSEEN